MRKNGFFYERERLSLFMGFLHQELRCKRCSRFAAIRDWEMGISVMPMTVNTKKAESAMLSAGNIN